MIYFAQDISYPTRYMIPGTGHDEPGPVCYAEGRYKYQPGVIRYHSSVELHNAATNINIIGLGVPAVCTTEGTSTAATAVLLLQYTCE